MLSIRSLSRKTTRLRYHHKSSEHPEEGANLEMGRYQHMFEDHSANTKQLQQFDFAVDNSSAHNVTT